jgi:cobalamin-dependent methionine synthase I
MIIIGEKLNSTIPAIRPAIEAYDRDAIADLALKQITAGASFIDINAGMFVEDEPERLAWMAEVVQEVVDAPLSIDSPNPVAIKRALEVNKNPRVLINSITAEPKRFDEVLPLILEYGTSVIALCMGTGGIPQTVRERMKIAEELVSNLCKAGMEEKDIYLDPLVLPIKHCIGDHSPNEGRIPQNSYRLRSEQYIVSFAVQTTDESSLFGGGNICRNGRGDYRSDGQTTHVYDICQ